MPKPGDVEDGYRFKGGDPSSQASWEAVTAAPATPRATTGLAGVMNQTGLPMEAIKPVVDFAKTAAIPTALSIIPPAATLAFPGNAPFVPLEQGAMGVAGTYLNKLLGISDPSTMDYALAGGLPPALGYGAQALRAAKEFFPPSKAAEMIQPIAMKGAVEKVDKFKSGLDIPTLFEQAEKQGARVPLKETSSAVNKIKYELANATPAGRAAWQSIAKKTGIDELASTTVPASPARIQSVMADVGKLQRQAAQEGGLQAEKLGKLFSALSDDLEKVPKLAYARKMFKRESVINEIDEAIGGAYRLNRGQTTETFSPNKIINALNDETKSLGKFFGQAFDKSEKKDILDFFRLLNTIPGLSPPQGVQAGSMKVLREGILGGSVGEAVGNKIGMPPGLGFATGAGVGIVGAEVADTALTMWKAWKIPGGRQLITSLLKNSDGALTPQVMGAIGAFVAGKVASPPTQPSNVIQPPTGYDRAFQPQP